MKLAPALTDALRLTRAGDLTAASAAIRDMLAGGSVAAAKPPVFDLKPATRPARDDSSRSAGKGAKPATVRPPGFDFVKQLGSGLGLRPATGRRSGDGLPADAGDEPGSFLKRRVETPRGGLDYRLYVPTRAAPGMPLVVMLHGCTQSPEDFARGTAMNALAEEYGVLVAYPGQPSSANAQKCWNWFKPDDQARDRGEPALIAAMTREVIAAHDADPARVYVAGLSAGGAAAAIMAAAYPDIFAAAGIHSGLACGAARDLPGALSAMQRGGPKARGTAAFVPVITFHGDADATVAEVNARQIVAAAGLAAGTLTTRTETGVSPGGRRYTRAIGSDPHGRALVEQWTVHGAGHAWSGGDASGSYTDPAGPGASRAMLQFFLTHRR